MDVSSESYEDEDHEEDGDALGELMELVKSFYVEIERFKSIESAEDFPILEADVLGSSIEDDNEYFIAVETLVSAPDEPSISDLKEESIVEDDCPLSLHKISHDLFTFGIEKKDREIVPFLQDGGVFFSPNSVDCFDEDKQSPTSQFVDQRINHPAYDNYESNSEMDMQDFQEHITDPYSLFVKENYHE
jgi:hypothetical protein